MKLKFVATALALASFGAQAIQASQTDWGVHSPIEVGSPMKAPGAFLDRYTFTIDSASSLSNTAVAANVSISMPVAADILQITDGNYSLWSTGGDGSVGGRDDHSLASWAFNGATGSQSNTVSPLVAGNYYYAVGGLAAGISGGQYTLLSVLTPIPISALTQAPVPEPETYAMMLSGLGAFGFLAHRRRRN